MDEEGREREPTPEENRVCPLQSFAPTKILPTISARVKRDRIARRRHRCSTKSLLAAGLGRSRASCARWDWSIRLSDWISINRQANYKAYLHVADAARSGCGRDDSDAVAFGARWRLGLDGRCSCGYTD
ncbi:hypothetical protein K0M31_010694 [Melipona bicolor]|uniref:Uncharacterized protein n=1 Tax=Melipona bicolor TaxID=60889 RepID=A0AA40FKX8_9HYME|nr:hypothetical protein K0M31_010694 [Melipona bicolor]